MGKLFSKNFWITRILMIPILFSMSGCIYLVVGGIGALGGYVVSPDTVEGMTDNSVEDLWDAAEEVVSIMGEVENVLDVSGVMVAYINRSEVTITIIKINESTTKLVVKARKTIFPQINLAQDVFVKILSKVNE